MIMMIFDLHFTTEFRNDTEKECSCTSKVFGIVLLNHHLCRLEFRVVSMNVFKQHSYLLVI